MFILRPICLLSSDNSCSICCSSCGVDLGGSKRGADCSRPILRWKDIVRRNMKAWKMREEWATERLKWKGIWMTCYSTEGDDICPKNMYHIRLHAFSATQKSNLQGSASFALHYFHLDHITLMKMCDSKYCFVHCVFCRKHRFPHFKLGKH